MNATEVATALEKKAVERDIGKTDIAAVMAILAKGDEDFEAAEDAEVRSGCSVRAICALSFFS